MSIQDGREWDTVNERTSEKKLTCADVRALTIQRGRVVGAVEVFYE